MPRQAFIDVRSVFRHITLGRIEHLNFFEDDTYRNAFVSLPFRSLPGAFGRRAPPRDGSGAGGQVIFRDDQDWTDFLRRLATLGEAHALTVCRWVLLVNRFHLYARATRAYTRC